MIKLDISTLDCWSLYSRHLCQQKGPNIIFGDANLYVLAQNIYGPHQANLVLIAYASSEGSGETAQMRSLARTFAACSYKH